MRNIAMLQRVKSVPAIPPPTTTFDTLICGLRLSSLTLHLLPVTYHQSTPNTSRRRFPFNASL
jgi:hypothetical protein